MATRNPTTITAPQDVGAFMAGIALFDEMLSAAAAEFWRQDGQEFQDFWLDAESRGGVGLRLTLLPALRRLAAAPELTDGFAAALGDYLATVQAGLCPAEGAVNQGTTLAHVFGQPMAVEVSHA